MNNPMQIIRAMQNPQQFLMQNPALRNDPRAKRAVDLMQRNDVKGLREMAENMCSEYGTTTDQVIQRIKDMF